MGTASNTPSRSRVEDVELAVEAPREEGDTPSFGDTSKLIRGASPGATEGGDMENDARWGDATGVRIKSVRFTTTGCGRRTEKQGGDRVEYEADEGAMS